MNENILTAIASIIAITGFVYTIVRNFKIDVNEKINKLDERMFYLATGKSLAQAILDEKMKKEEK